jgi:hypothetical protein
LYLHEKERQILPISCAIPTVLLCRGRNLLSSIEFLSIVVLRHVETTQSSEAHIFPVVVSHSASVSQVPMYATKELCYCLWSENGRAIKSNNLHQENNGTNANKLATYAYNNNQCVRSFNLHIVSNSIESLQMK